MHTAGTIQIKEEKTGNTEEHNSYVRHGERSNIKVTKVTVGEEKDYTIPSILRNCGLALVCVAQCLEHGPVNQMVAGLIPSQGICLGCGPGPQ